MLEVEVVEEEEWEGLTAIVMESSEPGVVMGEVVVMEKGQRNPRTVHLQVEVEHYVEGYRRYYETQNGETMASK